MADTKKKTREKTCKRVIPKGNAFSKDNQPSSEAKRKGRERRREAQKMMDKIMELKDKSIEELEEWISKNAKKGKVGDMILYKHVEDILSDKKMRVDRMNRHVSYAPQKQELSGSIDNPIVFSAMSKEELFSYIEKQRGQQ